MSFVMAVFILIPIIAPTLGTAITHFLPWRSLFWFCAITAVAIVPWVGRLPETLDPSKQRALSISATRNAALAVLKNKHTMLLLFATTAFMGAFSGYLSTSQTVVDQVFHLKSYFPLVFGSMAVVMGIAMLANSRLVMKFGLRTVVNGAVVVFTVGVVLLVVVTAISQGRPSAFAFMPCLGLTMMAHGTLIPNVNAAALRPLGAVAGTAAAIIGSVSLGVGSILGGIVSRQPSITTWPITLGFAVYGAVACLCTIPGIRATEAE
jgi:MFS transporter, DHA1 family, multidrug resistance protein